MIFAPASTFGLDDWASKLVLIAMTVAAAAIAFAVIRWLAPPLTERMAAGTDPNRARQRQTAVALLATMLRYVVLVAAVLAIVVILAGGGALGALGGSAVVVIVIGFASQRFLTDMIAGFFILFEGQYGVGDVIALKPSEMSGVVTEVGVRTTVLRDANGDRCFIPNGQITAVQRFPSARAVLSVTLLTTQPEAAESALAHVDDLVGAEAGVTSGAQAVSRRDIGGGVTSVHGRVAAAATQLLAAQTLVAAVLKARLGDGLVTDPVVSTVEPRESERPETAIEP